MRHAHGYDSGAGGAVHLSRAEMGEVRVRGDTTAEFCWPADISDSANGVIPAAGWCSRRNPSSLDRAIVAAPGDRLVCSPQILVLHCFENFESPMVVFVEFAILVTGAEGGI